MDKESIRRGYKMITVTYDTTDCGGYDPDGYPPKPEYIERAYNAISHDVLCQNLTTKFEQIAKILNVPIEYISMYSIYRLY
jgi:hypothetical protein